MTPSDKRPSWLPEVDLRAVTRDANLVTTYIGVKIGGVFFPWLEFGSLSTMGDGKSFIGARFERVTDFEHDSAYAARIDVIDVQLVSIQDGCVELKAWVSAESVDGVNVPSKSILSFEELGGEPCSECKGDERHLIIDSFTQKADIELWKRLRGHELRITIVPKRTEEPEES